MFAGHRGIALEPGAHTVEEEIERREGQRAKVRDIDPIRNPSEALLSAALNRLAKGSARQAPASVGAQLVQEFRRDHVHRRRTRKAVIALVACLVLATATLLTLKLSVDDAQPAMVKQPLPAVAPNASTANPSAATQTIPTPVQTPLPGRRGGRPTATSTAQGQFMALGAYDPAMVSGDLQVVRLELTGADLRLVGAPVPEDLAERHLLADIVLAGDGTPYAVRIVR